MITKYFLILCCAFVALFDISQGHAHENRLPEELFVNEKVFSWTTSFEIKTREGLKLGTVYRKIFSWTPEYHLIDNDEQLLAKATMQFWSFGATFDVTDYRGLALGTVEEKLTWFFPTFAINAPSGQHLAEAQLSFWETQYRVTDARDGHLIATFSRPFFRLYNNWTVQIVDPAAIHENNIHPQMFLTLMAFQVDKEYWEQSQGMLMSKNISDKNEKRTFLNEFRSNLENYHDMVYGNEPTDQDFIDIQSFTEGFASTESEAKEMLVNLLELFESEQLTLKQKAALYLMLENKLK